MILKDQISKKKIVTVFNTIACYSTLANSFHLPKSYGGHLFIGVIEGTFVAY